MACLAFRPAGTLALTMLTVRSVLALLLVALPAAGAAQPVAKISRIGYLTHISAAADAAQLEAFREGLRALGYIEGQNILIESRYADGQLERLPALAAELLRLKVDVIVAAPTPAIRAVQKATQTVPIVMAFSGDPVADGFVAGLARPGGNITGHSAAVAEMAGKRVEFLKAIVPKLSHAAHLINPEITQRAVTETEVAARSLGVRVTTISVRNARDVDRAFSTMHRPRVDGLIVALTVKHHWPQIVDLAVKNRLPTVSGPRDFVDAGGLIAYGPHYPDLFRRSAVYVDRILKGARPGSLPVEQPTRFEFGINRKAAHALGLTIPPSLLLQADHVVEQ